MKAPRQVRKAAKAATAGAPSAIAQGPASRREQLRVELPATVDSLKRRRADLVSEGFIEDYVALHWLEWRGGSLHLTVTGSNICAQMRAGL